MTEKKAELFAEKVGAGSRTYLFDVRESKDGSKYIVISESRHGERVHPRGRVIVFQEHLEAFNQAYKKAIAFLGVKGKVYSVAEIRRVHPKAYQKWTPDEDQALRQKSTQGSSLAELAEVFQRQKSAIRSRLTKLGLNAQ